MVMNLIKKIMSAYMCLIILFSTSCAIKEDSENTKLLYKACMNSEYTTIEKLLKEKDISLDECKTAEENDGDKRILDAVINATSIIDIQTCRLLIKGGAKLDGTDEFGQTYLHELIDLNSVGNGQSIELLNMMIDAGIDLNMKGKEEYNDTAFNYLMEQSPITCKKFNSMCTAFVENAKDLDTKTLKTSLIKEARIEAAPIILEAMEEKGVEIDEVSPLLIEVIKGDNTEKIITLIKERNYAEHEMDNIVIFAAANCSVEVMKCLDANGFDLFSHICEDEISALDAASAYNDVTVVEYLVRKGLDLDESCSDDISEDDVSAHVDGHMKSLEASSYTPISMALVKGNKDNVELLLEKGTTLQKNSWCIACIYGNMDSIDVLLDNNFKQQEEFIFRAYLFSDKETVNYMLEKGINYSVSEYGETLMESISNNDYARPLKELIENYE